MRDLNESKTTGSPLSISVATIDIRICPLLRRPKPIKFRNRSRIGLRSYKLRNAKGSSAGENDRDYPLGGYRSRRSSHKDVAKARADNSPTADSSRKREAARFLCRSNFRRSGPRLLLRPTSPPANAIGPIVSKEPRKRRHGKRPAQDLRQTPSRPSLKFFASVTELAR